LSNSSAPWVGSLWIAAGAADRLHELKIEECMERFLDHEAPWSELVALIAERSPEQIDRMERERGLA
jgi:hypothetical protein